MKSNATRLSAGELRSLLEAAVPYVDNEDAVAGCSAEEQMRQQDLANKIHEALGHRLKDGIWVEPEENQEDTQNLGVLGFAKRRRKGR